MTAGKTAKPGRMDAIQRRRIVTLGQPRPANQRMNSEEMPLTASGGSQELVKPGTPDPATGCRVASAMRTNISIRTVGKCRPRGRVSRKAITSNRPTPATVAESNPPYALCG